jgi:hypothetical protein
MFLDARQFEEFFKISPMVAKVVGKPNTIKYVGNNIQLELTDVRTFGSIARFYLDASGNSITTGTTTQPMTRRIPYRLGEKDSYKIMWNIDLIRSLPKEVVAYIIPSPELAEAGLMISTQLLIDQGSLWSTVFSLRRIEISQAYPAALLVFALEEDADIDGMIDIGMIRNVAEDIAGLPVAVVVDTGSKEVEDEVEEAAEDLEDSTDLPIVEDDDDDDSDFDVDDDDFEDFDIKDEDDEDAEEIAPDKSTE